MKLQLAAKQSSLGYLGLEHAGKFNSKASSHIRAEYGLSWEKRYASELFENSEMPAVSRGDFVRMRAGGEFPLTEKLLARFDGRILNSWVSGGRSVYREYSLNMEFSWFPVSTIK